jgi:two-component sensor histidine kinase
MLLQRLLILVLVTATPLVALLMLRENAEYESRLADVHGSALAQAQLIGSEQERLLFAAQVLLTTLSRLPAVRDQDRAACNATIAELVPLLPDYAGILIYDREGRSFCSSVPDVTINVADRDYFREALDGQRFTVGALTHGRAGNRFIVPTALPFDDPDGQPAGVVAAGIHVDRLAATAPASTAAFVIADRHGQIVYGPRMKAWFGDSLPPELMEVLSKPQSGTIEGHDPDGEMRVWGYLPLSSSRAGLFVAAGLPQSSAFAAMRDAVMRSAMAGSVAILVAFAAAYWGGWHFIHRPVLRILRAAETWRPGEPVAEPTVGPRRHELQRIAAALAALETRTNELLRHREFLVRELQHRVMNTLQILSSLLGLQALRTPTPEAREALNDAQRRVSAIASVYQRLYQHAQATDVDLAAFLRALTHDLGTAYHGEDHAGLFAVEVEGCRASPGTTITVATIVTEAVTNAIKHASTAGRPPRVTVRCARLPEGWRIEISDDGPGLPSGFDPASTKSLGLLVINRLINQLDGTAEFISTGSGLTVRLNLPPEFARAEREEPRGDEPVAFAEDSPGQRRLRALHI